MIKAPKVIVTTQEKLVVGTRTLGAPLHEQKLGARCPVDIGFAPTVIKKVIFKGEYPTGLGLQLLKESGVEYMKYEDALADETSRLEEKHELETERVRDFLKDPEPY